MVSPLPHFWCFFIPNKLSPLALLAKSSDPKGTKTYFLLKTLIMKNDEKFEAALVKHLTNCELDARKLKKFSAAITELRAQDFIIDRVFKVGTPIPDGLRVLGRVQAKDVEQFIGAFQTPGINEWRIWCKGQPRPDIFDFQFNIEEPLAGF